MDDADFLGEVQGQLILLKDDINESLTRIEIRVDECLKQYNNSYAFENPLRYIKYEIIALRRKLQE